MRARRWSLAALKKMASFKMLVDGGSFYRGKRKCDVLLPSGDGIGEAQTAIWSAVGLQDEFAAEGGQIEVCGGSLVCKSGWR